MVGPEKRIDHDHAHLNALLRDLDRALEDWHEDTVNEEMTPLEEAREIISLLKEDSFEHFEREEHGLFPNLKAEYPELTEDLDGLGVAHNEICDHLVRLDNRLQSASEDLSHTERAITAAAGKRLGALFWAHTAIEWKIIRDLLERVDDGRRDVIMKQLGEI